ncbi:SUMF1/EgtB/PvdO family nonheme iron enzyme [Devosia nitrariae]|uniref:Nitrate reductase n=1 Tax=Devosia nitrariae TaxID=2071872 RepID=A0ABQ5W925_9HYPH|nr:SUMF1/EgtB/PvdO family nonheme iron enzyme [Devosia nitrariae]GLQ56615.1 nitrate reductase [Devosia nitrariae]
MAAVTHPIENAAKSLLLPALLLACGLVLVAVQLGAFTFAIRPATVASPETVVIPAGSFTYRPEGHFFRDERAIDAPMMTVELQPVAIMKYQVRLADYALCVAEGACEPAEPRLAGGGDVPVTGVNYEDATTYAVWLSGRTGEHWELPTDREWAYAAGQTFEAEALGIAATDDPAALWLAKYEKEAARETDASRVPQPLGSFGINANGIADMGGNVWEWTQTCHRRVHIDAESTVLSEVPACTIRVLDGQHRASMSFFIRDAKSGGCSVGIPPDNLGFRLVRRHSWLEQILLAAGFGG